MARGKYTRRTCRGREIACTIGYVILEGSDLARIICNKDPGQAWMTSMEDQNIIIEELTEFSPENAERIRNLVTQLDQNYEELSDEDLQSMLISPDTHLIVAKDGLSKNILGMITLVSYRIPYKRKGWLEDLVVDEEVRGKGIGTMLLEYAVEFARNKGLKAVDLTSHPSRGKANEIYQSKGFENRGTNVYRVKLQ